MLGLGRKGRKVLTLYPEKTYLTLIQSNIMNIGAIVITGLLVIALVVFVIYRSRIDRRDLEEELNNDYKKTKDVEGDIDVEKDTNQ